MSHPHPSREHVMTKQQLMALAFPCIEAEHTSHPRFYWQVAEWSVGLTMNVGFE